MQLQINDTVFDKWKVTKEIGSGSFGTVYEVSWEDYGRTYHAAVKAISIPNERNGSLGSMTDGMTRNNVTEYYRGLVDDIIGECDLMERMKGDSHIVSYEDHSVIVNENQTEFLILMRMELLTPFAEYSKDKEWTELEVVQLGIDICRALETCEKLNIIHRDIKPENIFISNTDNYKLGDFGISKVLTASEATLSRKGTQLYMAPEVYRGEKYNKTADIYSLGLVLYILMNKKRAPFLPPYPQSISYEDTDLAIKRRMKGEPFPKPSEARDTLGKVIQKACDFYSEERYRSAKEFRWHLEAVQDELEESSVNRTGLFENPEDNILTVSIFDTNRKKPINMEEEQHKAEEKRIAEEQEKKRIAQEQERRRIEQEQERRRIEQEQEQLRIEQEQEQRRIEQEQERRRIEQEQEQRRIAQEQEQEQLRLAEEKKRKRLEEKKLLQEQVYKEHLRAEREAEFRKKQEEERLLAQQNRSQQQTVESSSQSSDNKTADSSDFYSTRAILDVKSRSNIVKETPKEDTNNKFISKDEETKKMLQRAEEHKRQAEEEERKRLENVRIQQAQMEKKKRIIMVAAAVGALVVLFVIYKIGMLLTMKQVPQIVGVTVEEATSMLQENDLTLGSVEYEYSSSVEKNQILKQSVSAGERERRGSGIDVVVSNGPEVTSMPDFTNMTETDVNAILEKIPGEDIKNIFNVYHSQVPAGCVCGQIPAAGEAVNNVSEITLIYSLGGIEMPELTGLAQADAVAVLAQYAFTPTVNEVHSEVEKDLIVNQNIPAGTMIGNDSEIVLEVSIGIEKFKVPDVVGLSEAKAIKKLTKAGYTKKKITVKQEYSSSIGKGNVISQSTKSGKRVKKGSKITITVSLGTKPAATSSTSRSTKKRSSSSNKSQKDTDDFGWIWE